MKYKITGTKDSLLVTIRTQVSHMGPGDREMFWRKGRIRQAQTCVLCGATQNAGALMWLPLPVGTAYKGDRICEDCARRGLANIKEGI